VGASGRAFWPVRLLEQMDCEQKEAIKKTKEEQEKKRREDKDCGGIED